MEKKKKLKITLDYECPQDGVYISEFDGAVEFSTHPCNYNIVNAYVDNFIISNGRCFISAFYYDHRENKEDKTKEA